MSEQTPEPNGTATTDAPSRTEIDLTYAGPSGYETKEGAAILSLAGNLERDSVRLEATIRDPIAFREALTALHAVVASDFRYVPRDKTAYLAYRRMRQQSANLGLWQAQQAYFTWLMRNDPLAYVLLDPVITVHPDEVLLEVFSKDEGSYAKLGVRREALDLHDEPTCGTTNIDFSDRLVRGLDQMRSDRPTHLSIGREGVRLATTGGSDVLEKRIPVPDSWLRGFLQVQSASTLPRTRFAIAPMDLYNTLRHLRLHADRKGRRRGLRIELVPGERPRLVLEPWETVIEASGSVYRGPDARVVRIWGRRRLLLLRRFLPFVEEVEVHLLGSGLPSFWVLRGEHYHLTLGLTGFTAADWSRALNFDLLLPRPTRTTSGALERIVEALGRSWSGTAGDLAQATGLDWDELIEALQLGCQLGRLVYDLASEVYRLRPLADKLPDPDRLAYRSASERRAHDLLARPGAVRIESERGLARSSLELIGRVEVREDRRDYRPQMTLLEDGRVGGAECTCPTFRSQGLKAGPCPHLVALRLIHARRQAQRRRGETTEVVAQIETRTFSRRDRRGEHVVELSLERTWLRITSGLSGEDPRRQAIRFSTNEGARQALEQRCEQLHRRGYLDATLN